MKLLSQEYIALKIKNCEELIASSTSKDQRGIYEAYKEYWDKQVSVKQKKINEKVKCSICGKEFSPQNIGRHEIKCRENEIRLEIKKAEELKLKKIAEEVELERLEKEKKRIELEKELEELKAEGIEVKEIIEIKSRTEKEPESTENNNI